VTVDYTLKNDQGEVLDTSEGRKPLEYLHGAGNLVVGLEKALEGKQAGDALEVNVPPEEGYGQRDERLVRKVPARKLGAKTPVEVGRRYPVHTEAGPRMVLVTALKGDYATIDANHELCGMTLHFAVKVVQVRQASDEEVAHGHPHGPEGHH
jgi:FKBP-type peptidyl-prolyl cis-trans isomerase SlyD